MGLNYKVGQIMHHSYSMNKIHVFKKNDILIHSFPKNSQIINAYGNIKSTSK